MLIDTFQISGSNQQILSKFVRITRIKSRYIAESVLQEQDWDLDKAIAWFNEHKDDDEEKGFLETEDEAAKGKPGISLLYTIHIYLLFC